MSLIIPSCGYFVTARDYSPNEYEKDRAKDRVPAKRPLYQCPKHATCEFDDCPCIVPHKHGNECARDAHDYCPSCVSLAPVNPKCNRCKDPFPVKKIKNGLCPLCRIAERHAQWLRDNPAKIKIYNRKYLSKISEVQP